MSTLHPGMLRTEVLDEPSALAQVTSAWDRLAVQRSRPFACPAWLCAWWRHAAPQGAQLRVVVVRDGDDVIGIAPWFLARDRLGVRALRPMGWPICQGVEPLAGDGREPEVAAAVARALATGRPPPDVVAFDGIDRRSPWPGDLARAWPGGHAATLTRYEQPTFSVSVPEPVGSGSWLASKSRHFRTNLGYSRRRFLRQGGCFRLATGVTLDSDLRAFARLHRARWESRGGSTYLSAPVERLLAEAGGTLIEDGRFRLWSLDLGDQIISSHLALRAGTECAYWLGGFDARYATLSPSLLGILNVIEDALDTGVRRVDLGGGSADWKLRFADDQGTLAWLRLVPQGRRHALARARLAPGQWRRAAASRVPVEWRTMAVSLERRILR
jgi:CelD/BcsL family acetyltransferase involved in cellulose biosynthesis